MSTGKQQLDDRHCDDRRCDVCSSEPQRAILARLAAMRAARAAHRAEAVEMEYLRRMPAVSMRTEAQRAHLPWWTQCLTTSAAITGD